ncbi:MAG: capsule biosynthesis protein [Novosphingobium sp.]|nr:capsule biosynthesis protein [Novosphingobium sp.]
MRRFSKVLQLLSGSVLVGAVLILEAPLHAQSRSSSDQPLQGDYGVSASSATRDTGTVTTQTSQSGTSSNAGPSYEPDSLTGKDAAQKSTEEDWNTNGTSQPGSEQSERRRGATLQPARKPSEFENFVSEISGRPIRRFGAELLIPQSRDFVAPPTSAIPLDYRINPGDQVIIGLTGTVLADSLRLTVNPEGRVFVPRVGAIAVAGVAYRDLHQVISDRVSRQYRDFKLSVALGNLHGITVYVTGFAVQPGSYTVSSISTLINAVLAAGGPAAGGSFRSIQVRRGGKLVSDFDLYDFLLKGDKRGDISLESGDVIFVAPAGAQVAAIGSVNREAIYEARARDTLNDVLLYAGGANTVADLGRVHILNPMNDNGWQEITPRQALAEVAQRGQILRVLSAVGIAQPVSRLQSLVTVGGEVNKPGRYFVKPGTTLDEVVAMAGGLTSDAYPFGAVFLRDSMRRQQQVSFAKATDELRLGLTVEPLTSATAREGDATLRQAAVDELVRQLKNRKIEGRLVMDVAPSANQLPGSFVVENNDSLFIPNQKLSVGIYGFVNSSADFRYNPGIKVRDYIKLAGGFSRYADKKHVFVVRANGSLLGSNGVLSAAALPGDLVFVPVNTERGAFWARLRDLVGLTSQSALTAASVIAVTK